MGLECSICERDIRGGHSEDCPRYRNETCECGHKEQEHDEEGDCSECNCGNFRKLV